MHERFRLLMSLVLDGAARPSEIEELARHLSACSSCAQTWNRWQSVDLMLSTAPPVVAPRSLVEGVAERLQQRSRKPRTWCWLPAGLLTLWTLWLGLSGLAMVGLLWWGWSHLPQVAAICSSLARMLTQLSRWLGGVEAVVAAAPHRSLAVLFGGVALCAYGLALLLSWAMVRTTGGGRTQTS
jgi:anti-sigma factor RsiW